MAFSTTIAMHAVGHLKNISIKNVGCITVMKLIINKAVFEIKCSSWGFFLILIILT